MRVFLGIVGVGVLVVLAFFAWVYSGGYDVAATRPHSAIGAWVLETVKRQSVRAHSRGIAAPPQLAEEGMVEEGARQYREDCQLCHAAPGIEAAGFARNMNPPPLKMSDGARNWTSDELFWVVKNGIRMTGMPAFGPRLSDDRIWRVVAFLGRMPEIGAERYMQLTAPAEPAAPPQEQQPMIPPSEGEQGTRQPPAPAPQ